MSGLLVHIKSIHVLRLFGIKSKNGYSLEGFSPGINIIFGPNASGKSTTATALQELLWPDSCGDRKRLIEGELSLGDENWSANLEPDHIEYSKNGEIKSFPSLGPIELRSRYHLSLHELLQEGTRNSEFAKVISTASQGGYDILTAAEHLGFDKLPGVKNSLRKTYNSKRTELREAMELQSQLSLKSQNLVNLKNKYLKTKRDAEKIEYLRIILGVKEIKREIDLAESEFKKFPVQMSQLQGNEKTLVDNLNEKIKNLEQKREVESSRLADYLENIEKCPDQIQKLKKEDFFKLKALNQSLKSDENLSTTTEHELLELEGEENRILENLGSHFTENQLHALLKVPIPELSRFADAVDEVNAMRLVFQYKSSWLSIQWNDFDDSEFSKPHEEAISSLSRWLSSEAPAKEYHRNQSVSWVVLLSSALMLLLAGYLGYSSNGLWWTPVFISCLSLFLEWRRTSRSVGKTMGDEKKIHENYYIQAGFDAPESWEQKTIANRLNQHIEILNKRSLFVELSKLKKQLEQDSIDLDNKEKQLQSELDSIRSKMGLDIDMDPRWFQHLLNRLITWQKIYIKISGKKSALDTVNKRIIQAHSNLNRTLQKYGAFAGENSKEFDELIQSLETQFDRYNQTLSKQESSQTEKLRLDENIRALLEEKKQIYQRLSINEKNVEKLSDWIRQLEPYQLARKQLQNLQAIASDRQNQLEKHRSLKIDHDGLDEQNIKSQISELENLVADREDLHREIVGIEKEIETMEQSHNLEDALNGVQEAKFEIETEYQEGIKTCVGHEMVQWLKKVTADHSRPLVFRRANQLIGQFSNHTLGLEINDSGDNPEFLARRTQSDEVSPVQDLSVGEKVQLLMAVRVAFLEQDETYRLPLILDEALGTSDDIRASQMIESVIEIAKSGRQIFYFTAQDDEVTKWIHCLDQSGLSYQTFDLESIRLKSTQKRLPRKESVSPKRRIPRPDGLSYEDYGNLLQVPGINPWDSAGEVHLWYLIEEPKILFHFLELGISNLGQFETFNRNVKSDLVENKALSKVKQKAEVLKASLRLWRAGRGKPVDRSVLLDSGAVSSTFINQVSELVHQSKGDAGTTLSSLRDKAVAGWRDSKTRELEEYFYKNNYLSEIPKFTLEDSRIQLVKQFETELSNNDISMNEMERLLSQFEWN